jgi:UDP-N-acetylglucosamine acyltransferase
MSALQAPAIDPRAVVDRSARLGDAVVVGPFSVIGADVVIGAGCRIGPSCLLDGRTELGEGCVLTGHVCIGTPPQDLKYAGEPTAVRIGARNTFREFTTVNRGTGGGGGLTRIGDDNLFMASSHVAHDCTVGNGTVFANGATLAGHVEIGDGVTLGAFSAVHQFCRVGRQAFIGGFTVMTMHVLPFMKTVGSRGEVKAYGPNRIGLERRGFPADVIQALQGAFRILHGKGGRTAEALERARREHGAVAEVAELCDFVAWAREGRGYHL